MPPSRALRLLGRGAVVAAVGAAYAGAARLGLLIAGPGEVSLVWPAAGLAVAAFVRGGPELALGVFAGALTVDMPDLPFLERTLVAAGDAAGPLLAAGVLAARGFRPALDRAEDVLWLALAGALGAVVSAVCGAVAVASGGAGGVALPAFLGRWWLGDLLGVLLVAPAILTPTWGALRAALAAPRRLAAGGLLLAAHVGLCLLAFLSPAAGTLPLHFLPFPSLIALAAAFGPPGAALGVLGLAAPAVVGTWAGLGHFGDPENPEGLLVAAGYLGVAAFTAQILAAVWKERRRAERSAAEAAERFLRAFRGTPSLAFVAELPEGRLIDVSDAFEGELRTTREAVRGRALEELSLFGPAEHTDLLHRLGAGRSLRGREIAYRDPDGSERTGLLSAEPVRIDGRPCALVQIVDVSERRELEAQLRESRKMEAVGQLAGGVAHDFNNLLTVIAGYADVASRAATDAVSREAAEEISAAAERASELTGQLLAFSRRQRLEPRAVQASAVLEGLRRLLEGALGERVTLTLDVEDERATVRVDPRQLEQAVLNLALNARDAMPEGGTLRIQTTSVALGGEEAARLELAPGRYVAICVADTGIGMDEATRARALEPFFTTKPTGTGTGLGLSTVYGTARQSGGSLALESAPGRGSTATLYLPRLEEEPREDASDAPTEAGAPVAEARGTTVLLVEDEGTVRRLLRSVLEGRGYRVLEAANGHEALEHAREGAFRVDLLVTDVVMPAMRGTELAEEMARVVPGCRVLFISGYAETAASGGCPLPENVPVLAKPFTPSELLRAVEGVLRDAPAG